MRELLSISDCDVQRGGRPVIRGVSFEVELGTWFGIIGANGSGKTSLLRAIGGRLEFTGGLCAINGLDVSKDRIRRAEHFGFAPPVERLPANLRVREILELVGGDLDDLKGVIGPIWEALEIGRIINYWIANCSSGMRQRVSIALAFAQRSRWVILDEPFNWLDPVAAFDLREALRKMVSNEWTLITALHDLYTLALCCSEGAMLVDGKIAMALSKYLLVRASLDPNQFEVEAIESLRRGKPSNLLTETVSSAT